MDDGSTDRTLEGLKEIKQRASFQSCIVVLTGNFGSYSAFHAGIMTATGDAIIQLHADLQDPPKHIPDMVEKWRGGAKLVIGQRVGRDEGVYTRVFSGLYHKMVKRFALSHVPSGGYDLILFDRSVADHVRQMHVHNINLVYLISWVNHRFETVPVIREKRKSGESQWSFSNKLKLVIDTLLGFSYWPVRLFRTASLIAWLVAVVILIVALLSSPLNIWFKAVAVIASVWATLVLLGIVLLLEYAYRIYSSSTGRPPYVVETVLGYDSKN